MICNVSIACNYQTTNARDISRIKNEEVLQDVQIWLQSFS